MNSPARSFYFHFIDDGSTSTVDIDTVNGAIYFVTNSAGAPYVGGTLNEAFNERPSDAMSFSSTAGCTVTKVSLVQGVLSLSLSGGSRPTNGSHYISGMLVY